MQENKPTYLHELLSEVVSAEETSVSREEILTKCYEKVRCSIEKIRRCYVGMKPYSDDELAQMMVMDACFILQFINKLSKPGIFLSENRLRSRSVALDLVLVENQVPFFVLKDIYDLTFKTVESIPSLDVMLLDLLERVNPFANKLDVKNLSSEEEITRYHILGFLHEFYQPKTYDIPKITEIPTTHSAVGLHEVGVRFRPNNQNMCCPMAIEFKRSWHMPTLRMPRVVIDYFFEVVMRNLIVYEQYSPVRNYVTSYVMAMDMLVATPADIAKLAESDVIVSHLGSNEKASNMISSICKDVTFLDFYYIESWQKVKSYSDGYWSRLGVLKRKCLGIVLFAGFILLVFAMIMVASLMGLGTS